MEDTITNSAITTVVRHFIKADKKAVFEDWLKNIGAKAHQFEGFEGLQLINPPKGHHDYLVLFKFANFHALERWMDSKERQQAIKKLQAISEKEMVIEAVSGIDFWFEAPEKKSPNAPPKWKMSILTWLAVFPGVVLLSKMYHFLFPQLSGVLTTLLVTLTLVPLLTWVLMPNIVKLFKNWIFSKT
jgi:antibiotic biosynthesis monooxygenase (ABM) superfamily enzyme